MEQLKNIIRAKDIQQTNKEHKELNLDDSMDDILSQDKGET